MTPRLSVAVMHAPWSAKRRGWLTGVLREVQRGEVVRLSVTRDIWLQGVWRVARAAWIEGLRAPGATHHLVLQDDVCLCPDFIAGVLEVLCVRSSSPVCLFAARKEIREALAQGKHWCSFDDAVWGPGLVLPTAMIAPFLAWSAKHTVDGPILGDDVRLLLYCGVQGIPIYCTAPSLVEHLGVRQGAAAEAGKDICSSRVVAAQFIHGSPLAVDWTAGASDPVQGARGFGRYFKRWSAYVRGVP